MTKVRFFSDVSHSHRGGRGSSQDWACKKFTSKYSFEKKRLRSDFRIGVPCIIYYVMCIKLGLCARKQKHDALKMET